jgi:hypothetical protein
MVGSLLKMVAYSKAPRTTFALRHPVQALQWKKMGFDMRHAYAPRVSAIGALALALPAGYLIGRRRRSNGVSEHAHAEPMHDGAHGTWRDDSMTGESRAENMPAH